MGKGSSTTQTQSSSSGTTRPDENAYQNYLALLNRASGVASTPYQAYGGEETAPINAQQTAGIGNINTQQGVIAGTGAPISAADIQRYQDPYTNQVIEATQKDFEAQNARQQSQVTGNAAAQGALGGDRSAVAAALTAESQNRTQNPVIAGLRSQGYQSAVKTAEDQQQQALRAGVAGLQGAQAQVGAGTLEQQTQQAKDTQGRMDYYQQQGYPFQVAQWLASIDTGVGSQLGGTSTSQGTSTTQGPTPNYWAQAAGLGLAGASMFLERGGRVSGVHRFAEGGGVDGYAGGGSPWGNDQTWVPTVGGISAGKGAPAPPSLPSAPSAARPQGLTAEQMRGVGSLGRAGVGFFNNPSYGGENALTGEWGGSSSSPLPGLSAEDYGAGFGRGGRIRRYANGGYALGGNPEDEDNTFDDRFSAAYPRVAAGVGSARPAFDVVNPDKPFRMLDKPSLDAEPPALNAWRSGVKQDLNLGQTAQGEVPEGLPPEVIAGRSKPPVMAAAEPDDGGGEALGYAGRPRQISGVGAPAAAPASSPEGAPDESFLSRLGVRVTPELKAGLLQAGLAMMANQRGGPGSFLSALGEAGMTGVGAYSQSQKLALEQAEKARKEAFEREKFERPYSEMTAAQRDAAKRADKDKVPFGWEVGKDGTITPIKGGPQDPETIRSQTEAKQSGGISDAAVEVMARQGVTGDQSWAKNIGRGAQGARTLERVRNRMADIMVNENGMNSTDAAKKISEATRDWGASQIGANAGARTRANREENLNLILKATDAAIPAALEASRELPRGQWVPINKIVQAGQVATSDPRLAKFGMANLQLAEHWARAMNPLGVMRESDRDLALKYLSTATSHETYEQVVGQLKKQITRERDAIHGNAPEPVTQPSPMAIQKLQSDPGLAKAFDEKYGPGASKRYLGN